MSSCRCVTRLRTIYTDEAFADLFPTHGQPAEAPWRLALVTVFQFMENLTDRLTWKYALSLELTDTGFDHTVLSEFRSRLVEGNAEQRLLDLLLARCRESRWRNRRRAAMHRLDPNMARKGRRRGWGIKCISPRVAREVSERRTRCGD